MAADNEVYNLLNSVDEPDRLWEMNDFTLQESGGSRYANVYDKDRLPQPVDDPLAHRLMECVDGKRGSAKWNNNGFTDTVENPNWYASLPVNSDGKIVLDQDTIFDLALLHSPAYRTALENVYLAALDVTAERFAFDTKFYGGESLLYNNYGGFREDSVSTLSNNIGSRTAVQRCLATGADIVVGIANSMVWTFGPNGEQTFTPLTTLGYSITQPLLRNAGRQIVLESLTKSERRLLANVRQLAFYQQGFYVGVLTGSYAVSAPSSGGYPSKNVSSVSRGGYYGLLSSQVQIRNQQSQVQSLRENLDQYEEYFKAGKLSNSLQVEQVRSQFLSGQSTLMTLKNTYESSIDSYLISIGLPPDVAQVAIQDSLLDQFTLMSPTMTALYDRLNDQIKILHNREMPIPPDVMGQIEEFKKGLEEGDREIDEDFKRLENAIPSRISAMQSLKKRLTEELPEVDSSICDDSVLKDRIARIQSDYHDVKGEIEDLFRLIDLTIGRYSPRELADMIVQTRENPSASPFDVQTVELINKLRMEDIFDQDNLSEEVTDDSLRVGRVTREDATRGNSYDIREPYRYWVSNCLSSLAEKMTTFRLVQTRIRLETVELSDVDIDPVEAIEVARENRFDWMNARSELVDTWRNIEIVANQLKGDLSVSISGQIQNEGENPVNFSGKRADMSASVEFDAPLTRLLERNSYRRALISYDQARRSYYTYVDNVKMQLRRTLREIHRNQLDLELKRESVRVAVIQVHQAQLKLSKPATSASRSVGDTSARDLVEALNTLLNSQNNFMTTWLEYQVQRMALLLQLGLFEIDERGRWIDPGKINSELLSSRARLQLVTQDELAGMNQLRPVEQLTGGLDGDALRRITPAQEDTAGVPMESTHRSGSLPVAANNSPAPAALVAQQE
ncbi:MAG: TolC family protein [Thermoguttaceae bacterium]|nr:TolC family protein [Thermoguttaceae bacterium]